MPVREAPPCLEPVVRSRRATSRMSSSPSPGCARGATSQRPSHSAFIATHTRPRHHERRATTCATKTCGCPSTSTSAMSTGRVTASSVCRRRSSPIPPTVRQRSPPRRPIGGTASPCDRAEAMIEAASASERAMTPSAGSGCALPHRASALDGHSRRRDGRGRGDHTAVQPRRCLPRGSGRRLIGHVGDLAQEVDDLLHVPHEVAARQVFVLEHVVEGFAGRPRVGDREEGRVRARE